MQNNKRLKPGDRVFRPRRIKIYHLKRVLGVSGLFSAGYGNIGSSIYYALGVVALAALGATPIALGAAGLLYIFNVFSYSEGGSMIPEAGGSASFASRGFNDTVGFTAGWALMLSYIVTVSISAYTIPPYLSFFWPALREPFAGTAMAMAIILFLMIINVLGVKESSRINIIFVVIDIGTQVTLVLLGIFLILLPHPETLIQNMFGPGNVPTISKFIYGIAIASLCFTGVETVSQLAEETIHPTKRVPQAYNLMIGAVIIIFAGISITALAAMTPQILADPVDGWARDPVAGIAANLPSPLLRSIFAPLVGGLAATILFTATNAGVMGISRLAYSMSSHQQMPATLSKIHTRFRTPYITIVIFCVISIVLLIPGFVQPSFFADLGALYVFGSLMTFTLAHAAILRLRVKMPDLPRPFKAPGNIKIRGYQFPVTAILGLLGTFSIWIIIIVTQPFSRIGGFAWMICGIVIYIIFRKRAKLPIWGGAKPQESEIIQSRSTKIDTSKN